MVLLRFRGFGCINRRGFISFTHISLMAGVSLATATLLGGSGYLIRELHRQATVASAVVGLPTSSADPSLLVPVSSDMFKVTAIALGATPAAIVNGKAVGKDEIVHVQTSNGVAAVRVVGIRDGAVEFKYGEQTILANLR
jgi:hypothetical protein